MRLSPKTLALSLSLMAAPLAALAEPAPEVETVTPRPGLTVSGGTVCHHPNLINDLMDVIGSKHDFFVYFHGYDISGHCRQARIPMTLISKLGREGMSFDGYLVETWEVRVTVYGMDGAEDGWVTGYAIIPSLLQTSDLVGDDI